MTNTNRYNTQAQWVAAEPQATALAKHQPELTAIEGEIVSRGQQAAYALAAQETHSSHIRQTDDAMSHAQASLLYSRAYSLAAGMVTAGLLLTIYLFAGGGLGWYFFTGLLVWGVAILAILHRNRVQGLYHSSTGVAHHDIDARADVAKYAIDRHCQMLEKKWGVRDAND